MRKIKYPSTAMVRDKLGAGSKIAKRIYALDKWAVSHGYDGYKAINRKTRADKLQQTELGI
jgi:hypothetical protein